MAAFDYAGLRDNTALPLLTRFGQAVTLINRTGGTYDPATLANTETTATFTGLGALFSFSDKDRTFTLIESNDRKLILDATNFTSEPELGDEVQMADGQVLVIKELMAINPAGTPVVWICRVGK